MKEFKCKQTDRRRSEHTTTQPDRCIHKPWIGMHTLWTYVNRNTHTPVHQSQLCRRSRWAAQTCGSSWWTPRDRLPGLGSCRTAVCRCPAASCWTDMVRRLPCSPRCALKRWWSHDLWWPHCSQASWSSGGFQPGCHQDWESGQSSWGGEWRLPGACLKGKARQWETENVQMFRNRNYYKNLKQLSEKKNRNTKKSGSSRKKGKEETWRIKTDGNWLKIKKEALNIGCAGVFDTTGRDLYSGCHAAEDPQTWILHTLHYTSPRLCPESCLQLLPTINVRHGDSHFDEVGVFWVVRSSVA